MRPALSYLPQMKRPACNDNIGVWLDGSKCYVALNGLKKEFNAVLEAKAFIDFIVRPLPTGKFKYCVRDSKGEAILYTNDGYYAWEFTMKGRKK